MWDKKFQPSIKQVRKFIAEEMGAPDAPVDTAVVPSTLQGLLPLACQFGIGDDPVREIAIDMMSVEFVRWAAREVLSRAPQIHEWAASGDWNYSKSAFVALLQGFSPYGMLLGCEIERSTASPEEVESVLLEFLDLEDGNFS